MPAHALVQALNVSRFGKELFGANELELNRMNRSLFIHGISHRRAPIRITFDRALY